MKKIYLSDSGPKVSEAIYGFYRWTEDDVQSGKMERIVNLCLESGINTFDHADIYGGYQVEQAFGKLLIEKSIKREDVVLFSKCGELIPGKNRPEIKIKHYNTSSEHILYSVENSLRNLKTDYIDVYLLNNLDPISDLESTALTLQKLKDSGKIKHIGIVNFSVFQHQLLSSYLNVPIVTNHIELNLLNTTALDNGQLDYIKQRYMRPLATAPLAEGKIANGIDSVSLAVRAQLKELSAKYNADIESLAVAWLVKLGALPLIGTTDEKRIKHIVDSFSIDIERQDWYSLYLSSKVDE